MDQKVFNEPDPKLKFLPKLFFKFGNINFHFATNHNVFTNKIVHLFILIYIIWIWITLCAELYSLLYSYYVGFCDLHPCRLPRIVNFLAICIHAYIHIKVHTNIHAYLIILCEQHPWNLLPLHFQLRISFWYCIILVEIYLELT